MVDELFRCRICGNQKDLSEFYPRYERGRLDARCKSCCAERSKAYHERNKAKQSHFPTKKRCWKCKRELATSAFGFCRSYADWLNPSCKQCAREYAKQIGNPAKKLRDPNGRKDNLYKNYRLRPDDYARILNAQDNRCAICESVFTKTPYVDHCHDTGRVRGLLCRPCNTLMAALDRPKYLEKAMNYLETVDARMSQMGLK